MSKKEDPEWEIVDSIPGERKTPQKNRSIRFPKKFWIGAGIGVAIAILFPPAMRFLMNFFRNLIAYWWILVPVAAYLFVRRRFKR